MERQITLEQVVGTATSALKNSLYMRIPGAIVAYHPDTQTADVQPMLNDPRVRVDTGEIYFEPWDVILAVPVAWPRFGGFVFSGPLAKSDPVVLEAFDLDPSPALASGRSTRPADAVDRRRHGGNYWLCRPTDLTGPIADAGAAGGAFLIGKDGDPAQIRFSAGSIQLGSGGGDFVALASKVLNELNGVQTALGSLMCPNSGTGPIAVSAVTPYSPSSVASALVKAQ